MILVIDTITIIIVIASTILSLTGGILGFICWASMRRRKAFLDYCDRKLSGAKNGH